MRRQQTSMKLKFHDNWNYAIYMACKWHSSQMKWRGNEFAIITEEKNLKDDSANFTIVMSLVMHNFVYSF